MYNDKRLPIFTFITLVTLLILIGGSFYPAQAFFSPNKGQEGQRDKRQISASVNSEENFQKISSQELQKDESWKSFFKQNRGEWKIIRDQKRNYLRLDNTKPSENLPRKLTNETDFVAEAKKFIQENESILRVSSQDLHLSKSYQAGGIWYVKFNQYLDTTQVYGTRLILRYLSSGQFMGFNANIYPTLDIQASLNGRLPTITASEAVRLATEDIGVMVDSLTSSTPKLVIYPCQQQEQVSYKLCWQIELNSQRLARGWRYFIDADTGAVIEGYDRARYAVSGKIRGQILPKYYNDSLISVPFPNLKIMLLNKTSPLMYENLDTDPGWMGTALFGWEYGVPVPGSYGMGGPNPDTGHSGSHVYGYNLQGSYPNNLDNRDYLTTLPIAKYGGGKNTVLRFWRWLGVEGSDSDKATIEINNNQSSWREIWSNPQESIYDGEWKLVFYDIAPLADGKDTLQLRWGMGKTNSSYSYCGWNIDDVGVYSSVRGLTDKSGNFSISGEAENNILDTNLKGTYFRVKNTEGEGLVYTRNNLSRNSSNINITLTADSNYNSQTDAGVISASSDVDELNAYYHANFLIGYLQNIDPEFLDKHASSFPISITVHNTAESDNSYWLQGDGIYLGEGNGFEYRDFSKFSDIIYHETTHAVTDSIYGNDVVSSTVANSGRFTQFDAMHEAFSDYWACTINNDPQIAEGGFWINHGALRNLDNELHYKLNYGNELYESSLVLSGAMWDLRQALRSKYGDSGINIANTLVLFATYAEPTSYLDFLLDVLAVDEAKYNNAHKSLIQDAFGHKGIAEPPTRPSSILVTVDRSSVRLSWQGVTEAKGYYLYYDVSSIKALTSRDYTDGSSGGTPGVPGGTPGDGGSGGWWGDGGDMTTNTQGGGTNPWNATSTLKNKVDTGNVTSYNLTNLQSNTTYKILLTAYNEYGIESSPSQDIYATPTDPNSSLQNYIVVPSSGQSSSTKKTCFISSLMGSLFGWK